MEASLRRRRRHPFRRPDNDEPPVNDRIRVPRVRVIDEEGTQLGEFLTRDAVDLANERGLDLLLVGPNERPPVAKIVDYGRMKYRNSKRDSAAKKNQRRTEIKEVKVRPKTGDHDMAVKIRNAHQFLSDRKKVKVTVRFRGREHAHHDIGAEQCRLIAEGVSDVGVVELAPRMEGRQMTMILAPTG